MEYLLVIVVYFGGVTSQQIRVPTETICKALGAQLTAELPFTTLMGSNGLVRFSCLPMIKENKK